MFLLCNVFSVKIVLFLGEKKPEVAGFFIKFTDEDGQLVLEPEEYVPEKERLKVAEKNRKIKLQKELKAYLIGRGGRPDFLPKSKD